MKRLKVIVVLTVIFLLGMIPMVHAIVFPEETNCILIDFHSFKKSGNLYFRNTTSPEQIEKIQLLIESANKRVDKFWGSLKAHPKFIYCESKEDFSKFGSPYASPALTHMKLGSYVIIGEDGVDLDILAHEISHTELFERIGFFNRTFDIPTWFDEGLAMQVDLRSYYSLDSLAKKSDNFKNLPDVTKLNTYQEFGGVSRKQIMLHYATAKYEIHQWYSAEKLTQFINDINDGKSFQKAYTPDE